MLTKGTGRPARGRWLLAQLTVKREGEPSPPERTLHGTSRTLLPVHMVSVLPLSSSLFVMVASSHHSLSCALPGRAWWWVPSPPSYVLNNLTPAAMLWTACTLNPAYRLQSWTLDPLPLSKAHCPSLSWPRWQLARLHSPPQ